LHRYTCELIMSYDVTFYILENKFVPAYCRFFFLTRYSPDGSYEKYQQYENNKLFKKTKGESLFR